MSRVAIVTGAKRGLGLGMAKRFAADGMAVLLADIKDASDEALALSRAGHKAQALVVDVSKEEDVAGMIAAAIEKFGRLDVLINNAMYSDTGPNKVTDHDGAMWDRIVGTNLKGPFLCSRAAIPEMRRTGGGAILNIGSEFGFKAGPCGAIYAATKAGLNQLTKMMAKDHAAENIRVNCLIPGPVRTPFMEQYITGSADPEAAARGEEAATMLKRFGTPEEIASVAAFLVSDGASFVTGALVAADGGVTAQ